MADARRSRTLSAAALLTLLMTGTALCAGCYRHVTDAKGIGSEDYTVYDSSEESNLLAQPKSNDR